MYMHVTHLMFIKLLDMNLWDKNIEPELYSRLSVLEEKHCGKHLAISNLNANSIKYLNIQPKHPIHKRDNP